MSDVIDRATAEILRLKASHSVGQVSAVSAGLVVSAGLAEKARVGDRTVITGRAAPITAEVVRIGAEGVSLLPDTMTDGVSLGDSVTLLPRAVFAPDASWIGRVIDPDGKPLDNRALLPGLTPRTVRTAPPLPHRRRAMGHRLTTGLAIFDTLLPIARGQRLGLFAGSGVGKSTLLADLANGVEADVIVMALVGERGREVRAFVEDALGPEGMKRAVVVAATSDQAPQHRRRCAWAATAVAEHFRDEGLQVLLLVDSVTRFAEAHRELAIASGEPSSSRGFPPSTGPAIAALCERAGPGVAGTGDITAIYTVLVAGSDMEEPVADMLRGVLDGHVVLDRTIAERGRFPAVDVLRSVSRCLPQVATDAENVVIARSRAMLGRYDEIETMLRAGLYAQGADAETDLAVSQFPALDAFMALRGMANCGQSFAALRAALGPANRV